MRTLSDRIVYALIKTTWTWSAIALLSTFYVDHQTQRFF